MDQDLASSEMSSTIEPMTSSLSLNDNGKALSSDGRQEGGASSTSDRIEVGAAKGTRTDDDDDVVEEQEAEE